MLKVRPGHKLPDHGHDGQEMTLILRGAYRDEIGRFAPGDVADLDEHIEHQPVIEDGEDCICLIATEAPARFKGLVPRLLQPIVGI
jgi:putative transcriptional regulator